MFRFTCAIADTSNDDHGTNGGHDYARSTEVGASQDVQLLYKAIARTKKGRKMSCSVEHLVQAYLPGLYSVSLG